MKRIAALAVGAVLIGGLAWGVYNGNTTKVDNTSATPTIEYRDKEVPVSVIDIRVAEAKEAALASTTAKAQASFDETFQNEQNKIEARILKEIEDEVKAQRLETEAEIALY